ncbi:PREDICTED: leucine-rich repeat-containing protein 37A-like [Capra hircus]|uniref:leucine-rich repeat-containing protein 37A-like n=1 Tax=Capra hircus TaxID=9925 RepID=UPI0008471CBC|nr:PREDICTED: leucine-rich repeat-containing protein 37A-like [Capra hircus]
MSRLRLWLLLTWQPLWLLVQAAQPLEWAQGPVQLTSDPPGLTEPWSSHSSDLPPESPHALTPLAEPGVFNYLTSSSPDHMLALPHEDLSETLVPYLDSDSAGELLAEPDKFAILHEDLDDKLTQHQKLPAAVPVLDWDQNQALVLPPRHKSKAKTVGLDQAENHQSFEILVPPLGSKSSKPTKFIVSPSNLKKDLVKHRPLAKVVVGTTRQLGKKNQGLEELQDDYLDSNMDAFYPEESLPTDFLGSPDQPPEPPEAEISSSQQAYHTRRPLPTEQLESLSQQESPEEAESFSSQEEAQAQRLEPTEEVEPPLLQQEALSQPSEAPEEVETSSPEEALAQPLETPKETVAQPVAHHKVQQSLLHNVTVKPLDLVLTLTPEVTKEVEPSPVQQEVLSQPPEHFEEVEPLPAQQEGPSEFPEQQEGVETPVQPEDLSQPAKHPETVASVLHQETPTQAPGFPTEYVLQIPISDEVIVQHGIQHQVHSNLHNVTFQPHNLKLAITPTIIKKTKFPATQQKPPETLGEVELSSEQEQPAQPSELTGEVEAIPSQQETTGQTPEEVEPSSSEQEQLTQPSEPTGEVEPSLTQQETLTQLSDSFGVAGSSPVQEEDAALSPESPNEAESFPTQQETLALSPVETESAATLVEQPTQHSSISNVTVKPADLELTHEQPAQPPKDTNDAATQPLVENEPPQNVGSSPNQEEFPAPPLKEIEPSPAQQGSPSQPPVPPTEVVAQTPMLYEVTVSTPGQDQTHHSNLTSATIKPLAQKPTITPEPSTPLEATIPNPEQVQVQHPTLTEVTVQPLDLELSIKSEPTKEEEPSPTMQELPPQPVEPPKEVVADSTPGQYQAQNPTLPSITVQPLNPEPTVTPEPTVEAESSTALRPKPPEVTLPNPEQVQSQLTEFTVQPLDLELTITPESTNEAESSPAMQETPAQHPVQQEVTVPMPAQSQLLPSVTVQPSGQRPNTIPEPTTEAEYSTGLQQTAAIPPYPELTQPHPKPVQSQRPALSGVTFQSLDLELTLTPESTVEVEPSPTAQQTQAQPPDLELTVTPEPATSEHSTALPQTTAPPPEQPEGTLAQPNLTEVTIQPMDVEVNVTAVNNTEAEPPPTLQETPSKDQRKKQPVQNATTTINVCKLCTCKDETLSCVGLSAKQKLHRVPEPGPNSYNGTFTILNFQGNYISYIDENIWKAYRWAEKLILSENSLTELHKDSFEGLLSLQYLDLSCNKIQSIERRSFEPLPFLQFINLGCNLLTELSFGTFQAWHGMQFLHKLILNRNPLTAVEDSYLFKLPALKYLDMGTTQVSLTTIESILMMTLELETLILPIRMACCLCQFKNTIEVVCKTVKLHCDSDCLTNVTFCDENASIGSAEGSFMKVLQARKKSTSTELTIEPERASSDKSAVSLSAFMNEQLDFNDESDVISALNYILPYFSEGNLEDVESTLLPFIQLLFTNAHEGDMPLGHFKNNTKNPSVKPIYNNSTYKNKLRKLYFLENLLDAEIQEKIDEVKKKEKTAMLIHANLLGPKFKRQIFPKKLETAQSQENSLAEIENPGQRLLRVNRVLKRPRGLQKRHFKDAGDESSEKKQNAQPIVENTAKERRLRRPSPRELDALDMVQRPRKLVGNSFNTEPSFIKEHKAAVSSFLKQYSRGRPSDPLPPKPQPEVQNKSKDLSYTIFILEDADARVRNMKSSKPVSHSRKKYLFHKARSRVAHKTPKAKTSRKLRKKGSFSRMMLARRPLFSAVRSLINSPPREAFSSSGLLDPQENRFSELYSLSDPPKENSSSVNNTPHVSEAVISSGNNTLPKETRPRITAHSNVSSAHATAAVDFMPPVQHTNETQWEYHNVGIEFASKPPSISFPVLSPGDQFESQLNQQLRSLIPNNDVRKLIAHVIRTLKMDCSETHVQLACAKLISRTGLLMKLLSEQQEIKVSKAEWDTDQWKTDNYINESTEAQSEQKEQESSELTKEVPGYGYNNKLILAISVTVVVMFLIIMFCLIERQKQGFFGFLLRKRSSGTSESQEGFFWRRRPLWLRDMYRPLNATRKKNMAQKLHDKESSEEDEIFNKDAGGAPAAPTEEAPPGTDSAAEEPTGEESEAAADTATE